MGWPNAQRVRELRAAAVASGLCQECRCRPTREARKTCQVCSDRRVARRRAREEAGLCRCGAQAEPGRKKCGPCADERSALSVLNTAVRASQGICAWQGGCDRPAAPDRRMCTDHLNRASAHARARRARLRAINAGSREP